MKAFKIKTHQPGKTYQSPHFFIISKGKNAGEPSIRPLTNSFVVFANSAEEAQQLFWICNILYCGNHFKTCLFGPLILFIHIGEVRSVRNKMIRNYEGHHWNGRFTALEKLERLTEPLKHQHQCLNEYKIALMQSYNLCRE
ncbi:hypothetical protein EI546_03465 [Aequorivita sp. H23M31]|uniref:Uncharacterized protein n=1 Tax=Aequorivita ciconiae TaxID=2494375 RepID=A0A410G0P9_9FLAO|nr:hypothetical protein [Aequorivita sp. H23M31]QAA80843.1 hypothetical protein EI546_03465 [Aequorivita sp. H23M31]